MPHSLRPFTLAPALIPKVWGGHNLRDLWGKHLADQDALLGEAWEVADLPEGQSRITSGALEGETLSAALKAHGAQLTGADHERFPLLVKLLDAAKDLSVQVHPGEHTQHLFEGARAKDECWLILHATPDGAILHGLREDVGREDFARCMAQGEDPTLLMRRVSVKPGDMIRVPPGTLHAICAGVSLLEIQQPSDTTYRVWDYARPGMDGELRALHLEQAMAVGNFGTQPPIFVSPLKVSAHPERTTLVYCEAYHVERLELASAYTLHPPDHSAQVLHVLEGACMLPDDGLTLERGDTAIVPACCDAVRLAPSPAASIILASTGA